VGTEAGRNASANRRKDKTNPGPFVCDICGADFTAKHNLRSKCFFCSIHLLTYTCVQIIKIPIIRSRISSARPANKRLLRSTF
jgi:predicted nucleic acid binding AN1-type Zn finger protein